MVVQNILKEQDINQIQACIPKVTETVLSEADRLRGSPAKGLKDTDSLYTAADCPGTASEKAGTAAACEGCPNQQACATAPKGPDPDLVAIEQRMRSVRHKILVLSGKGGVGKSTFASQLAFALAQRGKSVGLLDIDICGPSVPRMLGLEGQEIHQSGAGWSPVYVDDNLGVMSIGFMLPNQDDAVIWRGPRKNSLIKQFLKDVDWGEIDYLVVDAPPGTSDEHISIAQYLQASQVDGAVIVTTPQEVSLIDVRKEINFCRKVGIPVLGVVENMSGLRQAASQVAFKQADGSGGEADITDRVLQILREQLGDQAVMVETDVFFANSGGAEGMATKMKVPFLGRIPLDPSLSRAAEEGRSVLEGSFSSSLAPLRLIINGLMAACGDKDAEANGKNQPGGGAVYTSANGDVHIDPLLSSRIHLGF